MLKDMIKKMDSLSVKELVNELASVGEYSNVYIQPTTGPKGHQVELIPMISESGVSITVTLPIEKLIEASKDLFIVVESSVPSMMGYGEDYNMNAETIHDFIERFFGEKVEDPYQFIEEYFNDDFSRTSYRLIVGDIFTFNPDYF